MGANDCAEFDIGDVFEPGGGAAVSCAGDGRFDFEYGQCAGVVAVTAAPCDACVCGGGGGGCRIPPGGGGGGCGVRREFGGDVCAAGYPGECDRAGGRKYTNGAAGGGESGGSEFH